MMRYSKRYDDSEPEPEDESSLPRKTKTLENKEPYKNSPARTFSPSIQ